LLILLISEHGLAGENEARSAGGLSPLEAYDLLAREAETTFLIDVRTQEEYYRTGHPVNAYNIPWRFSRQELKIHNNADVASQTVYQLAANPNPEFVGVVRSLFKTSDRLLIICDDGKQSAEAADALLQAGFKQVRQVRDGVWGQRLFSKETPRLAEKYSSNYGRGGLINGWVYWGLPMSYIMDAKYLYPPDVKRAQLPTK
jgi:rhodanese-related sulfurtransferase